ncbi:MAG: hypothetical protein ACD_9C00025G0005 [uncultured bacterium]|nr:MAG: hypothetical protein ACD_9C00025G0005 [uncultured bacterium]
MKKINIDLNGRKINKEELLRLLNLNKGVDEKKIEDLKFINFGFDLDFFLEESAPCAVIIDYKSTLLTLAQVQRSQRKNCLAIGIIGIGDNGTIYLKTGGSDEQNTFVVGDNTLEEVVANLLSKSWFYASFSV